MVGPMAGANVAVIAKIALPTGRMLGGKMMIFTVKARGMSAPPVSPCSARPMIIMFRFVANAHISEKNTNVTTLKSR